MEFNYEKVSHVAGVIAMSPNDFEEQVAVHADMDKEDLYPTVQQIFPNMRYLAQNMVRSLIAADERFQNRDIVGHTVVIKYDQHTLYVWFAA